MAYAEKTRVPVSQSKADIEKLVMKYGAGGFGIMSFGGSAQVAFQMQDRNILFRVELPEDAQEERARWRALLLVIKAKLESAATGIETFEDAFLSNIVMPGGQTVGDMTRPAIESHYRGDTHIPLIPDLR